MLFYDFGRTTYHLPDVALKIRKLGLAHKPETDIPEVSSRKFLPKLFLPKCYYDFYSYLQPFSRKNKDQHFDPPPHTIPDTMTPIIEASSQSSTLNKKYHVFTSNQTYSRINENK
jgi:hypothetical protein